MLKSLESESIEIFREAVANARNPVMMYSVGKDSSVMLHLARKAFYPELSTRKLSAVAVEGGFMDTTAGGGWGPIVTTSLVGAGSDPKVTIGSVNYAEFY